MEVINSRLISWASILDDKTREQALATAELPIIYPHLALMPDAHLGLGATVGSVIPTLGAVIPAAVGVDIGCGMIAVRTQYALKDLPKDRKRLREGIEHAIPLSAGNCNRRITATAEPRLAELRRMAATAASTPPSTPRTGTAAGIAGIGQPFHRGVRGRDGRRVAVPALRLPRRGQQDRATAHRPGPERGPEQERRPAASGPGLPRGGHSRIRALHQGTPLGPALRTAES